VAPPNAKRETTFPIRGVPGGWRDPWDIDDSAELRAMGEAAERDLEARVATIAPAWQREVERERTTVAHALRSARRSR
jgi:hypothetical protein